MTILAGGRRSAIYKALSQLISIAVLGGNADLKLDLLGFPDKCRLFGLRKSLYNVMKKETFIKSAIVQGETCILKDLYNIETSYKIMPDGIWQYSNNKFGINFSQFLIEQNNIQQ
ncbi:uncharacterized protein LOC126842622 [Adelges cooleyi]|uniref:uncharacterized protein LOC126842622 n=1 Tax=Adelges cooleyi TaxID=133065 RepID=UPI00217F23C5|nr:uncharacterized protein LOC126842622 [Adelges cooleyi]